jgi:hypothetical protein
MSPRNEIEPAGWRAIMLIISASEDAPDATPDLIAVA